MITLTSLADSDHPHFAKDLFEDSFPDEERPPFGELKNRNNNFHFLVATTDENEPVGILTYWNFPECVYVEHFAIQEELRDQGFGKAVFLTFLSQITEQVVLEVEIPHDEVSDHRVEFYASMGLCKNLHDYWQPSYHNPDELAVQMMIMSKYELDDDEFLEVKNILYSEVYKRVE